MAAGMVVSLQGFERRLSSGEDQATYLGQVSLCSEIRTTSGEEGCDRPLGKVCKVYSE